MVLPNGAEWCRMVLPPGLPPGAAQMAVGAFRQLRKSLSKAAGLLSDGELAALLLLLRCGALRGWGSGSRAAGALEVSFAQPASLLASLALA